ncbi:M23 family metallopeptidase [Alicyclobacillus acidiphilus]|uniref:M23 family metallopeptidase n=1 Tax=Alicyclobacillus acidiphilus TaxID=182455 RepID=UPI0012EE3316|nr:peptidoglycan DD-metalloendopeptidase family protein [Alicyclobacillus acidiphilus]
MLVLGGYPIYQQISQSEQWLQVYRHGRLIGVVPDRSDIENSMERLAEGFHVSLQMSPVHTVVPKTYNWRPVQQLPTKASAILVNGKPIVYTPSSKTSNSVLKRIMQSLTLGLPHAIAQNSHFMGRVQVVETTVPVASILQPTAAERYLLDVSDGTNISSRGSLPSMGRTMAAFKVNWHPRISVESDIQEKRVVSVPYPVVYKKNPDMPVGQTKVLTSGQDGTIRENVRITYVNGSQQDEHVLRKSILTKPKTEVVEEGTNSGVATGQWIWPTVGDVITSPFGWRDLDGKHEFHPGIDIGVPIGTPIYATNNGTVLSAGWNDGGYGNWVEIDNGGGITTVFGHMSKVVATTGEIVYKGELIGYSGDTGDATGPHLHYEVRVNGTPVPPLKYT